MATIVFETIRMKCQIDEIPETLVYEIYNKYIEELISESENKERESKVVEAELPGIAEEVIEVFKTQTPRPPINKTTVGIDRTYSLEAPLDPSISRSPRKKRCKKGEKEIEVRAWLEEHKDKDNHIELVKSNAMKSNRINSNFYKRFDQIVEEMGITFEKRRGRPTKVDKAKSDLIPVTKIYQKSDVSIPPKKFPPRPEGVWGKIYDILKEKGPLTVTDIRRTLNRSPLNSVSLSIPTLMKELLLMPNIQKYQIESIWHWRLVDVGDKDE